MLECWNAGMLDCWNVELLDCWTVGLLDTVWGKQCSYDLQLSGF
jgi:hypothetical protein